MATDRAWQTGAGLRDQICAALGMDPDNVRRVVLDIKPEDPIIAYVEMIADTRILNVTWDLLNSSARLEFANITPEQWLAGVGA